jgi:sugar phosphate isomerase/epimerase
VDSLKASGYSGPTVLELARPFRRPEILRESIDALRHAGW